jgi:hypothetical protein
MSDRNRITDHPEVHKGEKHFSCEDFNQRFRCDEDKRTESHAKEQFVVSMRHKIEGGYRHEPVRDGRDAAKSVR